MSEQIINDIKKSIKDIRSSVINFSKSVITLLKKNWWIPYPMLIIAFIVYTSNTKTEKSYEDSILHEIQYARDILDYTLILRQLNIRSRPTFSLEHLNHLPKSFSGNSSLKADLTALYQSLSSAKKSTEDLMSLLPQYYSDPLTITNRDKDIEKAINMADKIGPQIARYIEKTWQTPNPNMSLQEKKEYYEKKTRVINSTATDTNISPLWQKNK